MGERAPTVIELMSDAHDADEGNPEHKMLVAVRMLRDAAAVAPRGWTPWEWLGHVIGEHGRMSKSDKPLSHTNPPSE